MALKTTPAAQYIRMSTEHQRYSPGHQAAAIAAYAQSHGYELVLTYADLGLSGLGFKSRPGLKGLIADVIGGQELYSTILVYDVSRWGRFQDPDQSAHYEFLCRSAGVNVEYCAEAFDNDGSVSATILKLLKRVMAAEYSRDLSAKVGLAHRRLAAKGLWQGAAPGYGLRRALVTPDGRFIRILASGEYGDIRGYGVVLVHGPEEEVEVVRRIFHLFLYAGLRRSAIARLLNAEVGLRPSGAVWDCGYITRVLTNEKYAGTYVYAVRSNPLGTGRRRNPKDRWVRAVGAFRPMISQATYEAVQQQLAWSAVDPEELLDQLRALLRERGRLSEPLIEASPYTASVRTYQRHFGSITNAYVQIGYKPQPGVGRPYTDDEMLEAMRSLLVKHGKLTFPLIDQSPDTPSVSAYYRHFGSLSAAYALVGWEGRPRREKLEREHMLEALRRLFRQHGKLSRPLIDADLETPCTRSYLKHFGSLRAAYQAAGYAPSIERPREASE